MLGKYPRRTSECHWDALAKRCKRDVYVKLQRACEEIQCYFLPPLALIDEHRRT